MFYSIYPHIDLTPTKPPLEPDSWWNQWHPIDVSGYVPSSATGIILYVKSARGDRRIDTCYGVRKAGTSIHGSIPPRITYKQHLWETIGVNASKQFEYYSYNLRGTWGRQYIYLAGFVENAVFFDDPITDKIGDITIQGEWVVVDCSDTVPEGATAIILTGTRHDADEVQNLWVRDRDMRWPGNVDSWHCFSLGRRMWWRGGATIVPCGSEREIQAYYHTSEALEDQDERLYITGYLTEHISRFDDQNELPRSIIGQGWQVVDLTKEPYNTPPAEGFAFFAQFAGSDSDYRSYYQGIRRAGETEDTYYPGHGGIQALAEMNAGLVEAYWNWNVGRFYYLGYALVAKGFIWVEGADFAYLDALRNKRLQTGSSTGDIGTSGYIWVDGNYLYYVGEGTVRRIEGSLTGLEGKDPGQISINYAVGGTKVCYIDSLGKERSFEGVVP